MEMNERVAYFSDVVLVWFVGQLCSKYILFYFLYFQLNFFLRIINTLFACRTKNTSFYSNYHIPSFYILLILLSLYLYFSYVGRYHKFESLYIFKISFNQTSVTFNISQYRWIQKSIFYGNAAKVCKVFEV